MTIEKIKDDYAIEQWYSDWNELILDEFYSCSGLSGIITHENAVIQLIQDELKKKIVNEHYIENSKVSNHILNTENIK